MLHCGVEQNEYKLNEENKTQLYAVAETRHTAIVISCRSAIFKTLFWLGLFLEAANITAQLGPMHKSL